MLIQQIFQYTIYTQSYEFFEGTIVRAHLMRLPKLDIGQRDWYAKAFFGDVLNRNLFGAALHMTNQTGQMC